MNHNVTGFAAKHLRRPGQEALLTVSGECKVPATYRAVLQPSEQQDDDPEHLNLDLLIHVPSGLPPTQQENRANLNIDYKMSTEDLIDRITITDIYADEDSEDKVFEIKVKQINWGTVSTAPESKRWKNSSVAAHRQN